MIVVAYIACGSNAELHVGRLIGQQGEQWLKKEKGDVVAGNDGEDPAIDSGVELAVHGEGGLDQQKCFADRHSDQIARA